MNIALFCNLKEEDVIPALDAKSIYEVPILLNDHGLDTQILKHFNIDTDSDPDLTKWKNLLEKAYYSSHLKEELNIAIVGKYVKLSDAYKSLIEALTHASFEAKVKLNIKWVNSRTLTDKNIEDRLAGVHAILVPGGFGSEGIEGMLKAITYARVNKVPYLGICLGMQLAVVEAAKNLCNLEDAYSTEFKPECTEKVVGLITEWKKDGVIESRSSADDMGGTMRLGSYDCKLTPNSKIAKIYDTDFLKERHRHRYEVNVKYIPMLAKKDIEFTGMSPDGALPEVMENNSHPWFVGVQFHPELKSRPFDPHPLFCGFINAAIKHSQQDS